MAYAPTVTFKPASDLVGPHAEVAFTSLHPSCTSLRAIWRLGDRREWRVRGSIDIPVVNQVARLDYEVPFGIPVTYRAEMLNAAGDSLGFTDSSAPFTANVDEMWIHNPLDPQTAVRADFRSNAARALSRPLVGESRFPEGRRVAVFVGGERQGLRDVVLDLIVDSIESADRIQDLFGNYTTRRVPVICFRIAASARVRLPRPLFAAVQNPRELDVTYEFGGETIAFAMEGDEAAPPTPALVIPLLTNADLNAYYATNAAMNANNLTNFDLNRRYDLAGTDA